MLCLALSMLHVAAVPMRAIGAMPPPHDRRASVPARERAPTVAVAARTDRNGDRKAAALADSLRQALKKIGGLRVKEPAAMAASPAALPPALTRHLQDARRHFAQFSNAAALTSALQVCSVFTADPALRAAHRATYVEALLLIARVHHAEHDRQALRQIVREIALADPHVVPDPTSVPPSLAAMIRKAVPRTATPAAPTPASSVVDAYVTVDVDERANGGGTIVFAVADAGGARLFAPLDIRLTRDREALHAALADTTRQLASQLQHVAGADDTRAPTLPPADFPVERQHSHRTALWAAVGVAVAGGIAAAAVFGGGGGGSKATGSVAISFH